MIDIRPLCIQTAPEGQQAQSIPPPRGGGSLRVSSDPSSSSPLLPAISPTRPACSPFFPPPRLARYYSPARPTTRRRRRRSFSPSLWSPFIWSPNSPPIASVGRSVFPPLPPRPFLFLPPSVLTLSVLPVRQNDSDVVVFHIKENLSDVAGAVLFWKTEMGDQREKGGPGGRGGRGEGTAKGRKNGRDCRNSCNRRNRKEREGGRWGSSKRMMHALSLSRIHVDDEKVARRGGLIPRTVLRSAPAAAFKPGFPHGRIALNARSSRVPPAPIAACT